MSKRFCTMPNIPWFRDWYENKFGDLCKIHDEDYAQRASKLNSDIKFVSEIRKRGYILIAAGTFIAVQMPWVWWNWFKDKP